MTKQSVFLYMQLAVHINAFQIGAPLYITCRLLDIVILTKIPLLSFTGMGLSFSIISIAKSWVHKHSRCYHYCILDQIRPCLKILSAILVYWMNKEDTQYPQQFLTSAKLIETGICNIQHVKLILKVYSFKMNRIPTKRNSRCWEDLRIQDYGK